MKNTNDEIRESILKYLYDLSKKAKNIDRSRCNERMVYMALKEKYSREEVTSNLIFLVQAGWVKQEKISKIPYFSVNDRGVLHFEGSSNFQKSHWMTGINVTNINGVTVIGDNNIVHNEFNELYRELDILKDEIGKMENILDEEKLNYRSEIETIKSQLSKKIPNKNIIKEAWTGLSSLSTVDGVINFYQRIEPLIRQLLN